MQQELERIQQITEVSQPYLTHLKTLKVTSDTSFEELYKLDDTSISTVNAGTKSNAIGLSIFFMAVCDLVQFFNDEWTNSQMLSTAELFYEDCFWFTFSELKHFTKKAKSLKFGKIFGKFTTAVFMDWKETYAAEAFEKRESHFRNKTMQRTTIAKDAQGNDLYTGEGDKRRPVVIPWEEPANPVSSDRFKDAIAELEQQVTAEKRKQDAQEAQERAETLKRYNDMLEKTAALKQAQKSKTTQQVPDKEKTDIP